MCIQYENRFFCQCLTEAFMYKVKKGTKFARLENTKSAFLIYMFLELTRKILLILINHPVYFDMLEITGKNLPGTDNFPSLEN